MFDFLVIVIVLALAFGLLHYGISLLSIPEPYKSFALIGVILLFAVLILGMLFGGIPVPHFAAH